VWYKSWTGKVERPSIITNWEPGNSNRNREGPPPLQNGLYRSKDKGNSPSDPTETGELRIASQTNLNIQEGGVDGQLISSGDTNARDPLFSYHVTKGVIAFE